MATEHDAITDPDIHEPKGAASASNGQVYIANGSGSGTWTGIDEGSFSSSGQNKGRILQADGLDQVGWQELVWNDLTGAMEVKGSGAGFPTRTAYFTNVSDWAFVANDEVDCNFHLPHDYTPGSDLYLHIHWSHNGSNISGTLAVTCYTTYAKGHDQANFSTEIAPVITVSSLDITNTPQYRHKLDEIQLSASTPSGTQLDSDDIEVDGIIMMTAKVTTLPTVTGGSLFIHAIDLHYQSSYFGTANKVPNFYS